jgi:hypothetical protein
MALYRYCIRRSDTIAQLGGKAAEGVATDGDRTASRGHAFDSPSPGGYMDVRTARSEEHQWR